MSGPTLKEVIHDVSESLKTNETKLEVIQPVISITPTDDGTAWDIVFNIHGISTLDAHVDGGAASNHALERLKMMLDAYIRARHASDALDQANAELERAMNPKYRDLPF